MGCNLLINGVYWGYNPLTNHLLTSWDIQVGEYISPMDPSWECQDQSFFFVFVDYDQPVTG